MAWVKINSGDKVKITIYIDVFLITNTLINYFLLKFVCLLSGENPNVKRLIFSAVIGSVLSLSIFFDINGIFALIIKFLSLTACCAVTFGVKSKKKFVQNIVYLTAAYTAFGGIITAVSYKTQRIYTNNYNYYININPLLLAGCIGFMYLLVFCFDAVAGGKNKNYRFAAEISGEKFYINRFYDTGFKVKDIVTGRRVLLCDVNAFKTENGNLYKNLKKRKDFKSDLPFVITPVFYSALNKEGALPAFVPDKLRIVTDKGEKRMENVILAVTESNFGDDIQAIFGKDIFKTVGV